MTKFGGCFYIFCKIHPCGMTKNCKKTVKTAPFYIFYPCQRSFFPQFRKNNKFTMITGLCQRNGMEKDGFQKQNARRGIMTMQRRA